MKRLLTILAIFGMVVPPSHATAQSKAATESESLELVSPGEGRSGCPSISGDGRFVLYSRNAQGPARVVHDRQTGQTTMLRLTSGLSAYSNECASISAGGGFVTFSGLEFVDSQQEEVFIVDLSAPALERVSVDSNDVRANNHSRNASVSADGRFVAFDSIATNLVPGGAGETGEQSEVYVRDRMNRTTERLSVGPDGERGDESSFFTSISADGRFVAFASWATNLVPGDANDWADVFVHDRLTSTTELVSVASNGRQGDNLSFRPAISADGRFVAFVSYATTLARGGTDADPEVYVHDRETGTTVLASVGISADQRRTPSISADGRYVAFQGPNVVSGFLGAKTHVRDLLEGTTETVSIDSVFEGPEGASRSAISADGRFVALDVFDTLGMSDVYVFATASTGRRSGLQRTPDGDRTLISKPVGAEQWAITQNEDDQSVTGNIFFTDGRPPKFVHCARVGDDGNPDPYDVQITFSCEVADACTDSSCPAVGAWQPIADSVVLPGSFFLPRVESDANDSATQLAPGAETLDAGRVASPPRAQGAQERASGLQRTPDGRRTLVSKPVGAEQWAITQNEDDQSVTGNIFFTDGRPPQFVHCARVGDDGNPDPYDVQITFSCEGADACTESSCPEEGAWRTIDESVVLPGSFFLPPSLGEGSRG